MYSVITAWLKKRCVLRILPDVPPRPATCKYFLVLGPDERLQSFFSASQIPARLNRPTSSIHAVPVNWLGPTSARYLLRWPARSTSYLSIYIHHPVLPSLARLGCFFHASRYPPVVPLSLSSSLVFSSFVSVTAPCALLLPSLCHCLGSRLPPLRLTNTPPPPPPPRSHLSQLHLPHLEKPNPNRFSCSSPDAARPVVLTFSPTIPSLLSQKRLAYPSRPTPSPAASVQTRLLSPPPPPFQDPFEPLHHHYDNPSRIGSLTTDAQPRTTPPPRTSPSQPGIYPPLPRRRSLLTVSFIFSSLPPSPLSDHSRSILILHLLCLF